MALTLVVVSILLLFFGLTTLAIGIDLFGALGGAPVPVLATVCGPFWMLSAGGVVAPRR